MVITIEKPGENLMNPLRYNYGKVDSGHAEIAGMNGCETGSMEELLRLFEMRLRRRVRDAKQVAFHMSVNPGEDDGVSPEQMPAFVGELMEGLGYGDQPWVLFRHKDIERTHYHVVSVRINSKGVKIDTYREFNRCHDIAEGLQEKYGFRMGNPSKSKSKTTGIPHYEKGQGNVVGTINDILMRVLNYSFTTERQFEDIMRCHGVGVKQGVYILSFQGLDENKTDCTPPIGEDLLDLNVSDALESRIEYCREKGGQKTRVSLSETVSKALDGAPSFAAFRDTLTVKGIDVALTEDSNGVIRGSNVIDHVGRAAMKGSELSRSIGSAIVALANSDKEDGQLRLFQPSLDRAGSSSRALLLVASGAFERKAAKKKENSRSRQAGEGKRKATETKHTR